MFLKVELHIVSQTGNLFLGSLEFNVETTILEWRGNFNLLLVIKTENNSEIRVSLNISDFVIFIVALIDH